MTHKPEVMSGESLDIAAQRRDELKQLFPGVFTETKDADGNVVSSIDFERLKAELGTFSDIYEGRRERYGMEWPGKRDCMKVIQEPSRATLKPCPDESVDWDTTKNLFIEGDNLEVLKLLQKSYYGKVKMIYIDPPYNTGNEFIYPDNYQDSLDTYLAYAGLLDDKGKKFTTNTASEGRYHTKWLNMLYPRLFLSRNLLREDGVIFISIDENESTNLRKACDEIFGEENHLGTIVWKNSTDNNPTNVAVEHEYIQVYCKNRTELEPEWKSHTSDIKQLLVSVGEELASKFSDENELNDAYKKWFKENKHNLWPLDRYKYIDKGGVYTGSQSVHNPGKEGYRYDVMHPVTGKPCKEPLMGYRFPRETMDNLLESGKILFGEDHNKIIELKVYAAEYKEKMPSVMELDGRLGSYDLRELFPEYKTTFTNPKPVRLIQTFIPYLLKNDGEIILDFFAGSSSTAEAVFETNAKDGINRRFIMIQLPEPLGEKTEALKHGFKTIADLSSERIRRAGKDIKSRCTNLDSGFKYFKLDSSCFRQWSGNSSKGIEQLQVQLDLNANNLVDGIKDNDILFEILLKAGFMPTDEISTKMCAGKKVYSIASGALLICLEEQLTAELIDEVIALEPMQFICLDKGFQGNDQLKANTAQAFKARSQDSEAEMVFKVV